MALARWKDLCMDAGDPHRLGGFWAAALGRGMERKDDGGVMLRGSTPEETIWVDAVPERKWVKHRVHLDVEVASLEPLLDLGARVLRPEGDDGIGWTVMADPEGGEFCAFRREGLAADPPARLYELIVDCASSAASEREAAWWAGVLGATVNEDGRGFWWLEDVPGLPFDTWDLVPVPEPKAAKNRIHWDVVCDDVDGLVGRGATVLRAPDDEVGWHVLADPGGNEFCAFPSPPSEG